MRVIGGRFRSRRLKTLPGLAVRPTPDRLREALFNVLAPRLEGVVFVDAYAGCGAVGIEALSRGAGRAIFIEANPAAAAELGTGLPQVEARDAKHDSVLRIYREWFFLRSASVQGEHEDRHHRQSSAALPCRPAQDAVHGWRLSKR